MFQYRAHSKINAIGILALLLCLASCHLFYPSEEPTITFPDADYSEPPATYLKQSAVATYSFVGMTKQEIEAAKSYKSIESLPSDQKADAFAIFTLEFPEEMNLSLYGRENKNIQSQVIWRNLPGDKLFNKSKGFEITSSAPTAAELSNHPWDLAHKHVNYQYKNTADGDEKNTYFIVEPDFVSSDYYHLIAEKRADFHEKKKLEKEALLTREASKMWPVGKQGRFWHKTDQYSQLNSALKHTDKKLNKKRYAKVGHLDTGYNPEDYYRPLNLDTDNSIDFTSGANCISEERRNQYIPKRLKKASHGQKYLSVLAGNKLTYTENDSNILKTDYIGGDPYADVRAYKISDWVVHFRNIEMTKAIYCAITNEIDIISLSAGGFPSIAQRDAVNAAYNNGTAIFAATGDFIRIPLTGNSIITTATVFPARYSRTMAVAGITADNNTYSEKHRQFWHALDWGLKKSLSNLFDWSMRGSYGPKHIMERNAISGFTPNIVTTSSIEKRPMYKADGAGTSASTPQASAAASLWLSYYRNQFSDKDWRSWKKVESLYLAMADAAKEYNKKFSNTTYFGSGPLKARDMLDLPASTYLKRFKTGEDKDHITPISNIGFSWITDTIRNSGILSKFGVSKRFAVLSMLITEIEQIIYADQKAFSLAHSINERLISGAKKKRLTCGLIKDLNLDNASETLKGYLAELLASKQCE